METQNRPSQPAEGARPPSLKAAYRAAEAQRDAIERGALSAATDGRAAYGEAVARAVAAYEDCGRRATALALFSRNESADDVATAHLPYLLLPFRVAELVQRLPPPVYPDSDPAARRAVLRRAREAYERFLHHLDDYGLLAAPYARRLQAYADDPGSLTLGEGGDANARRNAKIANFRAEKELKGKLEALRQRQDERRRRRKEAESDTREDEDDEEDDDDDVARPLYLAQLAYCAHMAFQGLEGLAREDEVLALAPAAPASGPPGGRASATAGGLGDHRQRPTADGYSDRLETITAPGGADLRRLQGVLGGVAGTGALLTKDGKPRQPFTIVGSRTEQTRAVFRSGHNLPTMSIDEYLEEERRRGGIIEGGGEASGRPPVVDEDDHAVADAETIKARAWDEFKEANPRGSGNTLNRG